MSEDRRADWWDLGEIIAAEVATPTAKRPWQSRTYWFIAVSMISKGVVLIPALSGFEIDVAQTTDLIMLAVSFLADFGALWGRDKAQGPIKWTGPLNAGAAER